MRNVNAATLAVFRKTASCGILQRAGLELCRHSSTLDAFASALTSLTAGTHDTRT